MMSVTLTWFAADVATRFVQLYEGQMRWLDGPIPGLPRLLVRVDLPDLTQYLQDIESARRLASAAGTAFAEEFKTRRIEALGFLRGEFVSSPSLEPLARAADPDVGIRFTLSGSVAQPCIWCVVVANPPQILPAKEPELTAVVTAFLDSE